MVSIISEAPGWFRKALDTPFHDRRVDVAGASIHYLLWDSIERADGRVEGRADGKSGEAPGIVLVHGNGAHAHWWAFIAPYLLEHNRVAALDLSGMGDSEQRERYSPELFAEEVVAVAKDAGFGDDTIVVGHSFGGFVTLKAGLLHADHIRGVVLVDSAVRPPDYNWERDPRRSPVRPKRVYPTFDAALERFRLMPPQDCNNAYILDYIGRHSITETADGFTWKFDDALFRKFTFSDMAADLKKLACRVGVIYGEDSYLFSQDVADYMFRMLDESVPFVAMPEAQHHLFLDQPLAFVAALRAVLAEWRHSRPQRGVWRG